MTKINNQNMNLAVIGNCNLNALIDDKASIVFSCWPKPDKDPIFNSLLHNDKNTAGILETGLINQIDCIQQYIENSPILTSLIEDRDGNKIKITDFFPRYESDEGIYAPKIMIRIIKKMEGNGDVKVKCLPKFNYNKSTPIITNANQSVVFSGTNYTLHLASNINVSDIIEQNDITIQDDSVLILTDSPSLIPDEGGLLTFANNALKHTKIYWESWVKSLSLPSRYQKEVVRAAIGLKLCWHQDSGGILAALTMGLPAEPDSNRNWDYRYCWLRDSYYTCEALHRIGDKEVLKSYKTFLTPILKETAEGHVQCMYDLDGNKELTETIENGLQGYRGMGPVLRGNKASEQIQLDCFGHVLNIFALDILDSKECPTIVLELLEETAHRALENYKYPDSGFWELRGTQRVHTNSAIISWSAMNSMEKIYRLFQMDEKAEFWAKEKDDCKQYILRESWSHKDGAFMGYFGGNHLDTTILCFIDMGMVDENDPRLESTVLKMKERLVRSGYILPHEGDDDFGERTCGFNICTFWYIKALHSIGEHSEAEELFKNMLDNCNEFGYLSEVIDPNSGELWGNYPQAYSLIGIIDTALKIA